MAQRHLAGPSTRLTDSRYSCLCLCPSEACSRWGGAKVSPATPPPPSPQSWGSFVGSLCSSANSGPVISFTSGDVCRGTTKYKTDIYMECDRSITTDDSKPVFQQSMSRGCTKVLFWSSPYACHSERTSCTHTAGDKFFDFTPLQANPGEKAWKTHHRNDENLCTYEFLWSTPYACHVEDT
ncbi:hypothetical protein GBAR_LOCUS26920 [Geodia barretti]|uniref:MRH domain-containing protein n=1 Tax=Geodia barretti TaxID=519541 RepID=A0AA35TIS7_GEOBA|nr:hypothetical protein GBAR_LOCUS26920 [Geodia barretti]